MNEQQAELYARIRAFDMDGGYAAFPFSARLARENGWSAAFTARAIEEYRRFVFLAVAARHPVTPSDAVDQVWHLHLTYTRSYWGAFCGDVLRTPLHHEPTRGGKKEGAKFDGCYRSTLESYRRLFGCSPPHDLWPDPEERLRRPVRRVWVDGSRCWAIPKPRLRDLALVGVGLLSFAAILFGVGCAGSSSSAASPRDVRGTAELWALYCIALAAAFAAAGVIRWRARGPGRWRAAPIELDRISVAYLNGGAALAVDAAIAGLVDAGAMKLNAAERTLRLEDENRLDEPPRGPTAYRSAREGWVDELLPLERIVYQIVSVMGPEPAPFDDVRETGATHTKDICERLVEAGLVVPERDIPRITRVPMLVAISGPILGVLMAGVDVFRGKPDEHLIPFVFIGSLSILAAWKLFMCLPSRTRLGDAVLDDLRERRRDLRADGAQRNGADLVLGMAIFGVGSLSLVVGHLAPLRQAIETLPSRRASDGGEGCGGCGCACCG